MQSKYSNVAFGKATMKTAEILTSYKKPLLLVIFFPQHCKAKSLLLSSYSMIGKKRLSMVQQRKRKEKKESAAPQERQRLSSGLN